MLSLLMLLAVSIFLMAETISITVPEPQIEEGRFTNELPVMLQAGQPQLAYIPVKILLPMGHKLQSIEVVASKQKNTKDID